MKCSAPARTTETALIVTMMMSERLSTEEDRKAGAAEGGSPVAPAQLTLSMPSLSQIHAARARLSGRLHVTPTVTATRLGQRAGIKLLLKCENLQKTGSFKTRGALNKISQLTPAERDRGVITVSAGNHAQAVAWAARNEGIRATVVMFAAASPAKVEASRGYGAEVVLYGESGIQSFAKARELEREHG